MADDDGLCPARRAILVAVCITLCVACCATDTNFDYEFYRQLQEVQGEEEALRYAAMTDEERAVYMQSMVDAAEHEASKDRMLRRQMGGYSSAGLATKRTTRGAKKAASQDRAKAGEGLVESGAILRRIRRRCGAWARFTRRARCASIGIGMRVSLRTAPPLRCNAGCVLCAVYCSCDRHGSASRRFGR